MTARPWSRWWLPALLLVGLVLLADGVGVPLWRAYDNEWFGQGLSERMPIGAALYLELVEECTLWFPPWFAAVTFACAIWIGRDRLPPASRSPGPWRVLLTAWGLLNLVGILPLNLSLLRFAALAGEYPSREVDFEAVVAAREQVGQAFQLSWGAILVAGLLTLWALTSGTAAPGRRPWAAYGFIAICGVGGAGFWWMSLRLAVELEQPFPEGYSLYNPVQEADLPYVLLGEGPNPSVEAPFLNCNEQLMLDGKDASGPDGLRLLLESKRDLWQQLNPGKTFPGRLIIDLHRSCSLARFRGLLSQAVAAGYPRIVLPFRRVISVHRPWLGEFSGLRLTSLWLRVRTTLEPCQNYPLPVEFPEAGEPAAVVARWLEIRKGQADLCLDLP